MVISFIYHIIGLFFDFFGNPRRLGMVNLVHDNQNRRDLIMADMNRNPNLNDSRQSEKLAGKDGTEGQKLAKDWQQGKGNTSSDNFRTSDSERQNPTNAAGSSQGSFSDWNSQHGQQNNK